MSAFRQRAWPRPPRSSCRHTRTLAGKPARWGIEQVVSMHVPCTLLTKMIDDLAVPQLLQVLLLALCGIPSAGMQVPGNDPRLLPGVLLHDVLLGPDRRQAAGWCPGQHRDAALSNGAQWQFFHLFFHWWIHLAPPSLSLLLLLPFFRRSVSGARPSLRGL